MGPLLCVSVGLPQLSDADADPSAPLISGTEGLHPRLNAVPDAVITGGVRSIDRRAALEIVNRPVQVSLTITS